MNCRRYAYLIAALLVLPAFVLAITPGLSVRVVRRGDGAVKRDGKLLFVYFGRYGCGYCEKTNRETFVDPEVKQRYTSHYVLAYVDAESGRRLRLPSGERVPERELGRVTMPW
ncbi:MAG: thioredoxin family protein [Sedimenticolaceae bacterium]